MKLRSIITAALALTAAMAAANGPAVEWLSTTHNFGAFDEDMGPVSCRFGYTNTGDEPLAVTAVHASCGCTTPRYDVEPLAPGDTAYITVTYDPTGRPGSFSKTVAVMTNTEPQRSRLVIKGVVIGAANSIRSRYPHNAGVMKMRENTLMAGEVVKGHLGRAMAEGYNRSTDSIAPSVEGLPPYLSVSVIPPKAGPGEQVRFQFFLDSSKCPLYGLVSDSLTITPRPGDEPFTLHLTAMIEQDFSRLSDKQRAEAPQIAIDNATADFGRIDRNGGMLSRSVKVANRGKRAMTIHRVYTADRGISVSVDRRKVKPGQEATVTVSVDPTQLTGAMLNGRITVITDSPSTPTAAIRAVGEL